MWAADMAECASMAACDLPVLLGPMKIASGRRDMAAFLIGPKPFICMSKWMLADPSTPCTCLAGLMCHKECGHYSYLLRGAASSTFRRPGRAGISWAPPQVPRDGIGGGRMRRPAGHRPAFVGQDEVGLALPGLGHAPLPAHLGPSAPCRATRTASWPGPGMPRAMDPLAELHFSCPFDPYDVSCRLIPDQTLQRADTWPGYGTGRALTQCLKEAPGCKGECGRRLRALDGRAAGHEGPVPLGPPPRPAPPPRVFKSAPPMQAPCRRRWQARAAAWPPTRCGASRATRT